MALTFTPINTDSFQRADESPLNPTNWTMNGVLPDNDQLEILNNLCTTTIGVFADGQGSYNNDALPNDQYVEIQIEELATENSLIVLYLRTNTGLNPAYKLTIGGPFNEPSVATLDVYQINGGSVVHDWNPQGVFINIQPHDVFRFAVQGQAGGNWFVYQNNVFILRGALNDSPEIITSGRVGLELGIGFPPDIPPIQNQTGVINFVAGSVTGTSPDLTYSVPDDRTFDDFPNLPMDVQGTETYIIPSAHSHSQPVDSRTSVPVDCRIPAIIPENCRKA